jgi:hypothetical protein
MRYLTTCQSFAIHPPMNAPSRQYRRTTMVSCRAYHAEGKERERTTLFLAEAT